jgi:hypothetical protein
MRSTNYPDRRVFTPRFIVATFALLFACARNDPAGEDPARTDSFRLADTTAFRLALSVSDADCLPLHLLTAPDSVRLDSALGRGIYTDSEPEYFCFAFGDGIYQIRNNGGGYRADARDTTVFRITWQNADSTALERVLVRPYEGDLLIALQYTDGEGAAGEFTRLERRRLRQLWRARIPAFNIGAPLVDGSAAYVTALGFVGRVNLRTGQYDWNFNNLYDPASSAFNSVESVTLHGDTVAFDGGGHGHAPQVLLVHRETGALFGRRESDGDRDRSHN